jgi:hypothetical protein
MGFRWQCPKCGSQGFRLKGDQSTTMYGELVKHLEELRTGVLKTLETSRDLSK